MQVYQPQWKRSLNIFDNDSSGAKLLALNVWIAADLNTVFRIEKLSVLFEWFLFDFRKFRN